METRNRALKIVVLMGKTMTGATMPRTKDANWVSRLLLKPGPVFCPLFSLLSTTVLLYANQYASKAGQVKIANSRLLYQVKSAKATNNPTAPRAVNSMAALINKVKGIAPDTRGSNRVVKYGIH
jgi:hypothetical protein